MSDDKFMRLTCRQKAERMWAEFAASEKATVRFGIFPADKMKAADDEGYDGRELAIALMDQASRDGGVRA